MLYYLHSHCTSTGKPLSNDQTLKKCLELDNDCTYVTSSKWGHPSRQKKNKQTFTFTYDTVSYQYHPATKNQSVSSCIAGLFLVLLVRWFGAFCQWSYWLPGLLFLAVQLSPCEWWQSAEYGRSNTKVKDLYNLPFSLYFTWHKKGFADQTVNSTNITSISLEGLHADSVWNHINLWYLAQSHC